MNLTSYFVLGQRGRNGGGRRGGPHRGPRQNGGGDGYGIEAAAREMNTLSLREDQYSPVSQFLPLSEAMSVASVAAAGLANADW